MYRLTPRLTLRGHDESEFTQEPADVLGSMTPPNACDNRCDTVGLRRRL